MFLCVCVADRGMAHSEESRLANLLRRVSREDDRDRRLASLKQLKEFISHSENKVVSPPSRAVINILYETDVLNVSYT